MFGVHLYKIMRRTVLLELFWDMSSVETLEKFQTKALESSSCIANVSQICVHTRQF